MKGKDHIRSRGEKNKRIRIKKGGKTRGKADLRAAYLSLSQALTAGHRDKRLS